MAATVEVATVPSADSPGTCIYLHHEKRAYLFGQMAEGTQRAFGSRKIHMGGTEQIFLSGSVGWDQMGGLVGYLLSVGGAVDSAKDYAAQENEKRRQKGRKPVAVAQHPGIGVHGGDNLSHILAACRPVIFRQPISVHPHETRDDPRIADTSRQEPDWQDEAIRVWKIPVRRARSSSPTKRRSSDVANGNGTAHHGSSPKARATLSDPVVASMIVERIMFNGSLNNRFVLLPKKLADLKPTDTAVVMERGNLKAYTGPYASEGALLANANANSWVFPDAGDKAGDSSRDEEVLAINHFPLPRTSYGETSMSYIVKCHDRRGKFNPDVAKEMGVAPRDFKLLTSGKTAEGKDGQVVTPDMVLGERQPGKGIVVADIGSRDFVDAFMERPEWQDTSLMENIFVMYWILGPGLSQEPQILDFTQRFPNIKHVFCAQNTCPNMITHPGSAEIQTKLRVIDPERFPLPKYDNAVSYPAPPAESPIQLGRAGNKFLLMPRFVYDDQSMAPFPDLVEAAKSVDGELLELAQKAKEEASNPEFLARIEETEKNIPNRDAEIIPLGTGSSVPSKHRNVSGTLIVVPGIGNYLLDCGEGTLGQIRRAFGSEQSVEVLRNLKCVVISHVHADHHMGTVSLIKAWYEQSLRDGSNATLAISCIGRYRIMLAELSQVEDIGFHRLRFPSCPLSGEQDRDITTSKDLGEDNFGLAGIKRIPVPHCWRSYGTELELTSGLRIAYSGDCRPSRAFAQACKGAHLLVHECTFGDDKQDHAKAKKHSTMAEALGVAREMGARRTLLTHFSQRYSKADSLQRERVVDGGEHSVLLAFDLMRVRLGDFQKAACYVPVVQKLLETLD